MTRHIVNPLAAVVVGKAPQSWWGQLISIPSGESVAQPSSLEAQQVASPQGRRLSRDAWSRAAIQAAARG